MRWTGTVSSFGLSRRVSVCAPHMGWLCGTKLQRLFVQRAHGVIECASVGGPRFDVVRPHVICIRGDGPGSASAVGRARSPRVAAESTVSCSPFRTTKSQPYRPIYV